jgi:hypothetical protein
MNRFDRYGSWWWDGDYIEWGLGGMFGLKGSAGTASDAWSGFAQGWSEAGLGVINSCSGGLLNQKDGALYNTIGRRNLIKIAPLNMAMLVPILSVASIGLFFAAMELGRFGRRALRQFAYLSLFCGLLHPFVMSVALGIQQTWRIPLAGVVCAGFGVLGSRFYRQHFGGAAEWQRHDGAGV